MIVSVSQQHDGWSRLGNVDVLLQRAAAAALTAVGEKPDSEPEVSVLLADDETLRALNRTYRGQDRPTNVLSFPQAPAARAQGLLGDIALAYETVSREADEQNKALADHVGHLMVHGVLHLLGYDHLNDAEADAMEALERSILAGLGIADPYASLPVERDN